MRKDKKKKKEKKEKKKKEKKKEKKKKDGKKEKKDSLVKTDAKTMAAAVKEQREKLMQEAAKKTTPVALPGNIPEVDDKTRFASAKANLERLRAGQQTKEKSVGYTVRKPNW